MKVQNMLSPRSGNSIANQFIIKHNGCEYFQSYDSVIAKVNRNNKVFLDKHYWNYSLTTSRYRNEFLGENTQITRDKIASGEYKLVDLNK